MLRFLITLSIIIYGLIFVTPGFAQDNKGKEAGPTQIEIAPVGQFPEGQTETTIGGDIFGRRGGYFHPFISVTEIYSDNIFRTNGTTEPEEDGFVTILSPGIWVAIPRQKEKILNIDTSSYTPGGLNLSREKTDFFRRYQTYLFYGADFEINSYGGSENAISHTAEGLFQYNLRGGLSFDLIDRFEVSHDERGTGTSTLLLNKFKSNLFSIVMTSDLTAKIRLRVDYSNYDVNFDATRNYYRDRTDDSFSWALFFQFTPKMATFGQYEFVVIDYDQVIGVNRDSQEHHYYGGLKWDFTARSTGELRAGYGIKDFAVAGIENRDDFILELQLAYEITPKSRIKFVAVQRTNETDIDSADFALMKGIRANYTQAFTDKLFGNLLLSYTNKEYHDDITSGAGATIREDDIFRVSPTLLYRFRDWLEGSIGYIYSNRDSDNDAYDYVDNSIYARLLIEL